MLRPRQLTCNIFHAVAFLVPIKRTFDLPKVKLWMLWESICFSVIRIGCKHFWEVWLKFEHIFQIRLSKIQCCCWIAQILIGCYNFSFYFVWIHWKPKGKKILQSFEELSVCNFEEISEERNAQFPLPDRQQHPKRSKKLKIHIAYIGFKVPCEIWFYICSLVSQFLWSHVVDVSFSKYRVSFDFEFYIFGFQKSIRAGLALKEFVGW